MRHTSSPLRVILSAWLLLGVSLASAQSRSALGATVKPRTLPTLGGGKAALLQGDKGDLVAFLPPASHRNGPGALVELARCQKRLARKPLRWVGVVSGREEAPPIQAALSKAGLKLPVLVDEGDRLFAELSGRVRPTVFFVDSKHVLRAVVPFHKVNFCVLIEAHARFLLGEIDEAELQRALHPVVKRPTQAGSPATRMIKLGRMLLKAKKLDGAAKAARRAIDADPKLAAAHALLGSVLAAQGHCRKATAAFDRALALDAANAEAKDGKKGCRSHK